MAAVLVHTQSVQCDPVNVLELLRALGFRRIGDSQWFGLPCCLGLHHPARRLGASQDFDPPSMDVEPSDLEQYETKMEEARAFKSIQGKLKDNSDRFRGYKDATVRKFLELRCVQPNLPKLSNEQVKYGCACGCCTGGFMSPRMLFTLVKHSGKLFDRTFIHTSGDYNRMEILANYYSQLDNMIEKYIDPFMEVPLPILYMAKDAAIGMAWVRCRSDFIGFDDGTESVSGLLVPELLPHTTQGSGLARNL